jgi:MFS family permease
MPTRERTGLGAVVAVASLISVAFMGSVVVTPLYSLYQRKFGFSEITLTLIYAVYAVGNILALLVFGQISDQVGRKRISLPAFGVAAASAVVFLVATSTAWLFVARLLIGFAVGILSGTGTAWLAELFGERHRARATQVATTANMSGVAVGPLLGGLLAQYVSWPLKLPFVVYACLLASVAIAIGMTPGSGHWGGLSSLRLQIRVGVPRERLRPFAAPAITAFVIFALGGLYFALVPGILIHDLHETNVALSGVIVFELSVSAAVFVAVSRLVPPPAAMVTGLTVLLPAVVLVVVAQAAQSLAILVAAAAVAGAAQGFGYRGSLEVVNELAPDDRRAEVVSTYLIACFVGNSVPVIGIGVLSTLATPLAASIAFAGTVGAFSVAALAWHGAVGRRGANPPIG